MEVTAKDAEKPRPFLVLCLPREKDKDKVYFMRNGSNNSPKYLGYRCKFLFDVSLSLCSSLGIAR